MAVATGVQQLRVLALDDAVGTAKEVAAAATKSKDALLGEADTAKKRLEEMKSESEAGAKRADRAYSEMDMQLTKARGTIRDTKAALDYERGRNATLENTVSTMADRLCPAPTKRNR